MAASNNTIKTRIQLKSDTEANWNKAGPKEGSNGFVPLSGELIVYAPDATHPFSRLKIGDGATNIVNLPFIDSGTLNGHETEIVKAESRNNFPQSGSNDKLYVDTTTKKIYHYTAANGYTLLSNFTYSFSSTTIKRIVSWLPGTAARATVSDGVLTLRNGSLPELLTSNDLTVITEVTKEE